VEGSLDLESAMVARAIHELPAPSPTLVETEDGVSEAVVAIRERHSGALNLSEEVLREVSPLRPAKVNEPSEEVIAVPVPVASTSQRAVGRQFGNGLAACGLALAAVVLPAVLLALGLHPRGMSAKALGSASAKSLGATSRASVVPSLNPQTPAKQTGSDLVAETPKTGAVTTVPNATVKLSVPKPETVNATGSASAPANSHTNPITSSKPDGDSPVTRRHSRISKDSGDFVAKNTVTYLDERYRPTPKIAAHKKRFRAKHAASRAIAANTAKKSRQASN
jgi:hypothetical protein